MRHDFTGREDERLWEQDDARLTKKGIQSRIPSAPIVDEALRLRLSQNHIHYYRAGEIEWPIDSFAGWYFSDETESLNGPFPSAIVALMELDIYVAWLEGVTG